MVKELNNNKGFTLIEIMIAISIFAVFVVVYITGQGSNVLDSINMKEEVKLSTLAQNKLNEVILDPPEYRETLTSNKETKTFEADTNYEYSIEFKRFEIPTFEQMTGADEQDQEQESQNAVQKNLFNQIKQNLELIIWQVEITVSNKETKDSYTISTWLENQAAIVRFNY